MYRIVLPVLTLLFLASCKKEKQPDPIPSNKAVTWAKSFGGNEYEFMNAVVQLSDGSYVTAGATRSTSGDFSGQQRWGYDVWVAKIDNAGNKSWYSIFGDNDDNYATGIAATSDGGFIVIGYTFVTNMNYAWAIKTNSTGAKQWQVQLTNSTDAKAMSIVSNNDGSFTVSGYSSVSGSRDGWITKIDGTNGNAIWNKTFGGSGEDQFTSLIRATDGSYVVSGYTNSSNGDMTANKGNFDGWIMRIDGSGNKTWSVNFGGSDEDYLTGITQATDGSFVTAGYTRSTNGDIPLNKGAPFNSVRPRSVVSLFADSLLWLPLRFFLSLSIIFL